MHKLLPSQMCMEYTKAAIKTTRKRNSEKVAIKKAEQVILVPLLKEQLKICYVYCTSMVSMSDVISLQMLAASLPCFLTNADKH